MIYEFDDKDTLVAEVANIAKQFSLSPEQALSLVVGVGLRAGQEQGIFGPRAVAPERTSEILQDLMRRYPEATP